MSSLAATYGFTADSAATFSQELKWRDSSGALIDLTGYSASMTIRERTSEATSVLTLTTENGRITLGGSAGTVTLSIAAGDVPAAGRYTYTLNLTSSVGTVTRLLMGEFIVRSDTFRI